MKTNYFFLACFSCLCSIASEMYGQTTITQWDFNSAVDYSAPTPSTGNGSALLVGGTTGNSKSGSSADPLNTAASNLAWQTAGYAPLGTMNKQCGVQFNVSTAGFQSIVLKFDQRMSKTANSTYQVQYTADRTAASPVWIDSQIFTFTPATNTAEIWHIQRTVDFSNVPSLNNNPNVGIRVVSMYDPTAENYIAASNDGSTSYSSQGTVRYDMVTFSGTAVLSTNDFISNEKSFSFYPNPTNGDMIHFNDISSIYIYDFLGKEVLNANDVIELNLSNLIPGVYFIRNEKGYTTKLIKN